MRATFDTNLLGDEDLLHVARSAAIDVAFVSVSHRESEGSSFAKLVNPEATIPETMVWDESRWDESVWGDDRSEARLEIVLKIVSAGSFPARGLRSTLSSGQRRQLRDAMIFCDHVRELREIFVTNDAKGFIDRGRREALEREFRTKIMTAAEFVAVYARARDV